jgi:hypothetical protein
MTRFLPTLSFLGVAFASHFLLGAKIDDAIPMTGDSFRPVFVRMDDQLFRKAGDHETFCKAKSDVPRSTNRKETFALLRKKADDSWEKIKGLVVELEKAGSIRGSSRFWIVNGFSCFAKPEAIRRLAEHNAVSFVYLDRLARSDKAFSPHVSFSHDRHEGSSQVTGGEARREPVKKRQNSMEPEGDQGDRSLAAGRHIRAGRDRGGDRLGHFTDPILGHCPLEKPK